MSSETNKFYGIAALIYPYQQEIIFDVAFHIPPEITVKTVRQYSDGTEPSLFKCLRTVCNAFIFDGLF